MVIPCYNEADALPALFARLVKLEKELSRAGLIKGRLRVILVDDGSSDATWSMIHAGDSRLDVHGLKLSRNQGHQSALVAGLEASKTDVTISMDADLQDDPSASLRMVQAYRQGAEIVFGVRESRTTDTLLKRSTAQGFYRLINWLGAGTTPDHADYRLMSRRALTALREYDESNLYLRGLVHQLGFETAIVKYDRSSRVAGESKYNLARMLSLALNGITSFSISPLRMIAGFGMAVAVLSFLIILYSLGAWAYGAVLPGWTSTVLPIYLLGGVHLVALGVIGEYVGKIYIETKRRPRYHIEDEVLNGAVFAEDSPAMKVVK